MITLLNEDEPKWFPNPIEADDEGLVAVSEKLGTDRLIEAYIHGIFPWMKMDYAPHFWCWFSPNPRMVLFPNKFKTSKSLQRVLKNKKFEIRINQGFTETMKACAHAKRPDQEATWIEKDMIEDYTKLHELGVAHSVEAFLDEKRVGGLYGLALGRVFCGESMFHTQADASKVCLAHLVEIAKAHGISLIDCQVHTPHLESMGAQEIARSDYLKLLQDSIISTESVVDWPNIWHSS
ncbi:MAG: leucyl/phenylalanyl-tRNA--protein transferase [Opitutales bacterium]|nr:leucyl/phenylalanyl-tRNA--protein transferase [Opitutales bacterium]